MKIRCNLRVTILFLRLNLSLLHLGPVQIPRFTQNLELRPIEVQKSWVSVLRLVGVSVRVAVLVAPGWTLPCVFLCCVWNRRKSMI